MRKNRFPCATGMVARVWSSRGSPISAMCSTSPFFASMTYTVPAWFCTYNFPSAPVGEQQKSERLLRSVVHLILLGAKSATEYSLHVAAAVGNIEAFKQHLAAGADVNAKDEEGGETTPLYWAAQGGHKEIVELLIAEGAGVNTKFEAGSYKGQTPLDRSTARNHIETTALLRKHSGQHSTLHRAVSAVNLKPLKEFLDSGGDVNEVNERTKSTFLHLAVWNGHENIIQFLVANGANINTKNNLGFTPLDSAQPMEADIADLLRKHGGKTGVELKAEGK